MAIHPRGRNRWRVRLWHRGNQHEWIVKGAKSDAEAFEARKRLEFEAMDPLASMRVAPSFRSFAAGAYLSHAETHLKPATLYQERHYIPTLGAFFGDLKLTELRGEHVDAFVRQRKSDGLRVVSINNELRRLRRVLNFARGRGIPCSTVAVREMPQPQLRPKAWTLSEVTDLLRACERVDKAHPHRPAIHPVVLFLLNTGCRKGEALAMRWEQVDFERREVRIWPIPGVWSPKSGKPREVPISDALWPLLKVGHDMPAGDPVFRTRSKLPYETWPKRAFSEAVAAAGLTGGPHRLRHTFASLFLARRPDLGLLAAILGHSDEAVTRLYAHMVPDRLERARNAVSIAAGPVLVRKKRPRSGPGSASQVASKGRLRAKSRA